MFNGKSLFGTTRLAGGFRENSSFVGVLYTKKSQYCVNPAQYCDLSLQTHIFIFFLKMTTASMYITTAYASTTAICVGMAA